MNPFERYGIDPSAGPLAITERMRELAEDATSEEERAEIRCAWEELTMHPRRRVELALGAHPESREEPGRPPRRPRRARPEMELELRDLVPFPSVAAALGAPPHSADGAPTIHLPDIALSDDPVLRP